jgi:type IV pilus assembly protein PilW
MNGFLSRSSLKTHHQPGFTLVEVLVGMVIGLVLIAGLAQLLVGNRQTYRFKTNLSQLQESGGFALELLARHLRMAGYRADWQSPLANPLAGVDGASGASDQFTVRYQSATDCLGNNVGGTPPIAVNVFSIANSGGVPNLFCDGDGPQVGTNAKQPLVAGVEDLQILYGEDTDAIGDGIANQYATADAVNMARVVSVRVQLRLRSPDDNLTDTVTAFGDRRIRRVFTSTVTLRNSMVNRANLP